MNRCLRNGAARSLAIYGGCIVFVWCWYLLFGAGGWPLPALMSGVLGAALASALLHSRRHCREMDRMDRSDRLYDRIDALLDSIPCRTEAETLAALHEIRNCYAEGIRLYGEMGDRGRERAAVLRRHLGRIDDLYDIQTGSLRRTEANAAEFAAAMRRLGRDADGSLRR